jgi:DNA-binding response OmpR family regulator
MRVLVVDDEAEMAALLARGLGGEGHEVVTAGDGITALEFSDEFDVAVLDVMLPGMSGFELCRRIKSETPGTSVILLTARDAVDDRVRGLDAGADDYLTKPFAFAELAARIRAVRRRESGPTGRTLVIGDLHIDLVGRRLRAGEGDVRLSGTEFDVLVLLADHADHPVSRADLLLAVWGSDEHINPNVVDQYVSYLRRKLAQAAATTRIVTVRGVGYSLVTTP